MTPDLRVGECDVCVLVRGDHSEKETGYCGWCKAWMCEKCRTNHVDRAVAATKRFFARPKETK